MSPASVSCAINNFNNSPTLLVAGLQKSSLKGQCVWSFKNAPTPPPATTLGTITLACIAPPSTPSSQNRP